MVETPGAAGSPETALITGATAGLGAEFAGQLAGRGYNLVLVARDSARLAAKAGRLRQESGIRVETISADLETDSGVAAVVARLLEPDEPVTMLVNNAGYGLARSFEFNSMEQENGLLKILVATPMQLMHAALGPMLASGHGSIINVASMAGFVPHGTYSACKAWLINFSRWANVRYGRRGVHVTAVCPGFVRTEFHDRMGVPMSGIPGWMWLQPDRVVSEGLSDALAGRAVSIPSRRYRILAFFTRFAPARLIAATPIRR